MRSATRFAAVHLALLSGCSYLGSARDFDPAEFSRDPRWIRCDSPAPIRQREEKDCGAAAAAMVLAHWNRPATPEVLWSEAAPEAGHGLTAGEIVAAFERRGLKAFTGKGTLDLLLSQVGRGRPAIVGLVKPHLQGALAHFEVVVAWHPVDRRVVTLDPARGWRENGLDAFFDEWEPSGRVLLVAFEPE